MPQTSHILVDDKMNELLIFSPDQVGFNPDRPFGSSSRTPRNSYRRILGTLYEQVINSPACRKNAESHLASVKSFTSSAATENVGDNTGNDAGIESSNMLVKLYIFLIFPLLYVYDII